MTIVLANDSDRIDLLDDRQPARLSDSAQRRVRATEVDRGPKVHAQTREIARRLRQEARKAAKAKA